METRTYNGYTYQRASAGEPWALVGPATAPSAPMSVVTKRADPAAAFEVPKAQADLERTRIQTQGDQARLATAPYDARKAAADASKAEAEATKAARDLQAQQATANPEQQKRMAALGNDEVLQAIDQARSGVDAGMSAGYWARLGQIPLVGGLIEPQGAVDLAASLNTVASRLTLDKLGQLKQASPTGASGLGSLTEKEGALLRDSVAALGQTQSPDNLRASLGAVEKHYRNYMALAAGEDYRDPKVAEKYGIMTAPAQGDAMTLANGKTREEADPALKGVNSHIRGMIGSGRKPDEIVAYMNSIQPGLGDQRAGDVMQATKFRAQNPNVPLSSYQVSVENRSVPMSDTRQLMNSAGQSPFGAYMLSAGDALTAGTLDNLQGNPALARAGMKAISENNPKASIAGMLSGGALAGSLGESAVAGYLGRGAVAAAPAGEAAAATLAETWAPRLADVGYGAAYGAGSADEGSRLAGAGWGALGGAAGGEIGRRGMASIGTGLQGVRNESAQYLRERGVPLTIGQILGGARKAKEDRLAGYAGVGDKITAQRRGGIRAFNQVAFDEGLAPISQQSLNQVGEEGIDTARQAISGPNGAYGQALNGVSLVPDAPFQSDVAAALVRGRNIARTGPEFDSFVQNSVAPHFSAPNGQINGRQVQDILQQVRGADFGSDSMGALAGDATRDIEGAVMDLAGRQAPGSMEALGNANTAYRNLNILADAVGRGINQDGMFMPSQLGAAAKANTTKFGGKIAAATPDRPFYELQRAGQEVLPSKIPDSGTAGRVEQNGGITAALRSGVRNAVNAPLYADSLQEPIARLLMDRSPEMIRLGEMAAERARIAGLLSRPASLAYGPLAVTPEY